MPIGRDQLLERLEAMDIEHSVLDHPPVFTVEESKEHTAHLPGAHVKNLVLKDKSGTVWLVTCRDEQQVKVNGLARLLGAPRFSFAKADILQDLLGVEPGSVTPLALVNDLERAVRFVIDQTLLDFEQMNVHPMVNSSTVTLSPKDLLKFIETLGYQPIFVDLEASHTA